MFTFLNNTVQHAVIDIGRYCLLMWQAIKAVTEIRTYYQNLFTQMVKIGIDSLPIVLLTAAFTGAVTTVQSAYQLVSPFIPRSVIGGVVSPSIILELGAVLPALVLAGRIGARIAAELGTMRVTEQVDALEAMGLNSVGFLVVPRVLAGVSMFPLLYIAAVIIGIGGAMVAGETSADLPAQEFLKGARQFFNAFDPVFGIIKACVFGFLITSISCSKGYYTSGGAEGVGNSTTQAAVTSCIFVLLFDYLLAELLL
ncbi:MAG TPA: ABC transporter permease [Rhodothermales bacterium]|nr:ABC transporter permease [Bacteroidota bacterium]HRK74341.1 ABC transporter permease [Rhodothermales bacterium]HRR08183.1 ABC transporter permease [Rhodothermales bacterium]